MITIENKKLYNIVKGTNEKKDTELYNVEGTPAMLAKNELVVTKKDSPVHNYVFDNYKFEDIPKHIDKYIKETKAISRLGYATGGDIDTHELESIKSEYIDAINQGFKGSAADLAKPLAQTMQSVEDKAARGHAGKFEHNTSKINDAMLSSLKKKNEIKHMLLGHRGEDFSSLMQMGKEQELAAQQAPQPQGDEPEMVDNPQEEMQEAQYGGYIGKYLSGGKIPGYQYSGQMNRDLGYGNNDRSMQASANVNFPEYTANLQVGTVGTMGDWWKDKNSFFKANPIGKNTQPGNFFVMNNGVVYDTDRFRAETEIGPDIYSTFDNTGGLQYLKRLPTGGYEYTKDQSQQASVDNQPSIVTQQTPVTAPQTGSKPSSSMGSPSASPTNISLPEAPTFTPPTNSGDRLLSYMKGIEDKREERYQKAMADLKAINISDYDMDNKKYQRNQAALLGIGSIASGRPEKVQGYYDTTPNIRNTYNEDPYIQNNRAMLSSQLEQARDLSPNMNNAMLNNMYANTMDANSNVRMKLSEMNNQANTQYYDRERQRTQYNNSVMMQVDDLNARNRAAARSGRAKLLANLGEINNQSYNTEAAKKMRLLNMEMYKHAYPMIYNKVVSNG